MNTLDKKYTDLLQDILDNGVKKEDRTGTGTLSVFGRQIRHKMSEGFPLITTKKMYFKGIVTELLWFLRGDTNIKYLVDNDCHIWDGDAYKAFERWKQETDAKIRKENPTIDFQPLEYESKEEFINKIKTDADFAEKWGDLGPVYGAQWRGWKGISTSEKEFFYARYNIDQVANSLNLLKTDPDSRRNKVSAWNVGELDQMTLPPCHTDFQFYTRELSDEEVIEYYYKHNRPNDKWKKQGNSYYYFCEESNMWFEHSGSDILFGMRPNCPKRAISLMWNQRSVDTFLGLPFNIASYGLLLEIIAKEVNMVPDELIGNLGDTHLYLNHIEQAKEQIGREFSFDERVEYFKKTYPGEWDEYELPKDNFSWYNIPTRTREPYPLPILKHMKTDDFYKSLSEDLSLLTHLDNTDFVIEGYHSHPTIKAKLSN